ncbi:MAG: hypothetical protein LBK73_06880 [Treponema sp.]|jgi:hypothetical protein|nr:hypothetical protein [Treponema sp.]
MKKISLLVICGLVSMMTILLLSSCDNLGTDSMSNSEGEIDRTATSFVSRTVNGQSVTNSFITLHDGSSSFTIVITVSGAPNWDQAKWKGSVVTGSFQVI